MADGKTRYVIEIDTSKGKEALKSLDEYLEKFNNDVKSKTEKVKDSFGGITSKIQAIGAAVGAAFIVSKVIAFGRAGVQTAMDFEMLKSRIVALKGSQDAANKAFETYKQIAATTPFDLKGLTSAAATMEAFGIDSEKNLKTVANLAAYMGTSAEEAAAAWGRAWAGGAGAADIFRERGILNLLKLKSGVTDLTKQTLPEFRETMLKVFNESGGAISSATDIMSKTAVGGISNMKDAWDSFNDTMFRRFLPGINAAARGVAGFLESITPVESATEKATKAAVAQKFEFEMLVNTYKDLNSVENKSTAQKELYLTTIGKLKSTYPEYLGNLDLEKTKFNLVEGAIDNARIALEHKINVSAIEAGIADREAKAIKARGEELDTNVKIYEIKQKLIDLGYTDADLTYERLDQLQRETQITYSNWGAAMETASTAAVLAKGLIQAQKELTKETDKTGKAEQDINSYKEANKTVVEELAELEKKRADAKGKEIKGTQTTEGLKAEKDAAKLLEDQRAMIADLRLQSIKDDYERETQALVAKYDKEYEAAKGNAELQKLLTDKVDNDIADIDKKYADKKAKNDQQWWNTYYALEEEYINEKAALEKKANEQSIEEAKKAEQKKKELIQNTFDAMKQAMDIISSLGSLNTQREIDELTAKSEAKIANAEMSMQRETAVIDSLIARRQKEGKSYDDLTKKKLDIEKKYEANISAVKRNAETEEKRIKEQQKKWSIAQSIINTAEGVTKAWAQGGIFGFIGAGLVAIAGAVQIAMIRAQKFAKGGLITEPTHAIMGEAGEEIVAPKKDFLQVVNDLVSTNKIKAGMNAVVNMAETNGLLAQIRDSIQSLDFRVSDTELALSAMSGMRKLNARNI